MVFALCRLVLPDHRRVHHVCPDRICDQGASCATPVHVWLSAQGGTWSSVELSSGRRRSIPFERFIRPSNPGQRNDSAGCAYPRRYSSINKRGDPRTFCAVRSKDCQGSVCSAFVTARRKAGKSGRSEEMIAPNELLR